MFLLPVRRQAIIWTSAGILFFRTLDNVCHISEAYFNNDFSITIQIRLKFHVALIQVALKITAEFWTWHDSCVVVACENLCSDMIAFNEVVSKPNSCRIWLRMETSLA